jgi:hypothetical protein
VPFQGEGSFSERLRAELLAEEFLGVMEVGGHHVFELHAEAGAGRGEGQPTAQRPSSNDGDDLRQRWWA